MTNGELLEEIDSMVEEWHRCSGDESLQQFLHMDDDQFDYWAMTANIPPNYLEQYQVHQMWINHVIGDKP